MKLNICSFLDSLFWKFCWKSIFYARVERALFATICSMLMLQKLRKKCSILDGPTQQYCDEIKEMQCNWGLCYWEEYVLNNECQSVGLCRVPARVQVHEKQNSGNRRQDRKRMGRMVIGLLLGEPLWSKGWCFKCLGIWGSGTDCCVFKCLPIKKRLTSFSCTKMQEVGTFFRTWISCLVLEFSNIWASCVFVFSGMAHFNDTFCRFRRNVGFQAWSWSPVLDLVAREDLGHYVLHFDLLFPC